MVLIFYCKNKERLHKQHSWFVLYNLEDLSVVNKGKYFAQNYDHIYNTKQKSKILQYPLHKAKKLEISTF